MGGDLEERLAYLQAENEKLRRESYRDEAVKIVREELERGFPISKDEEDRITDWQNWHEQRCDCGKYTYCFSKTRWGAVGSVKCGCGAEFEFRG